MIQELWIVFSFEFFVLLAAQEQKQRTASLIVLPPLVLGYDELYEDKSLEKTPLEKLKQNVKQPAKAHAQAANAKSKNEKLISKNNNVNPNSKSNVRFTRQGHKLNFMGHFLLPHNENDCPFHDSPDPKFELMSIHANRRSQGKFNLRRNLENIVKGNLLKSLARPHSRTVNENGDLVVSGKVLHIGDPKAVNKRNNKLKEIVTVKNKETVKANKGDDRSKEIVITKTKGVPKPKTTISRSFGAINGSITANDLLRELAAGMLSGILLNQ